MGAMSKPRLLDLFCGAGGAAMGYSRAGFEVVGIDILPQPRYPFEFIQADAMTFPLEGFDAIHASPPCQGYTVAKNIHPEIEYPLLIEPIRERLVALGDVLYVIENVPPAPLINYVTICGRGLGLGVKRHRKFETNSPLLLSGVQCPKGHPGDWIMVFGGSPRGRAHKTGIAKDGGPIIHRPSLNKEAGELAMGIDWMTRNELSEAIPPAYTHWLGHQLMAMLRC
jgi:hypothetical protein